jgi:hypothetical protein
MDPRPLAAVRILASLCIVYDLLRLQYLDLVWPMFGPSDRIAWSVANQYVMHWVAGDYGGIVAFYTALFCFTLVGAGIATGPAIVVGVITHAQIGHLYVPGDRAIDRILRTVMLIILFTPATRVWTVFDRKSAASMAAWPVDLIRFILVMVYTSAGTAKVLTSNRWLNWDRMPELYRIIADPSACILDPAWAEPSIPLWRWFTVALEHSSFLILTPLRAFWGLDAPGSGAVVRPGHVPVGDGGAVPAAVLGWHANLTASG